MNPPDDLRAWAAAYRSAGQPPDDLRARIVEAMDDAIPSAPRVRRLRARRPCREVAVHGCIGAIAAIAVLMVLGWIARWMGEETPDRADPSAAPYQPRPREHAPFAGAPPSSPAAQVAPAELGPPPQGAALDPVVAPTTRVAAPGVPSRLPTQENPSSPTDAAGDLEGLRRLRSAKELLPTDPGRAREILDAHARSYPDSPLALEREALWIRAACRAGGEPTLAQRRATFARHPGIAAYQAAIDRDCGVR
jgi:hypothetical protein